MQQGFNHERQEKTIREVKDMKVDRAIKIALQYRKVLFKIITTGGVNEQHENLIDKVLHETRDIMEFLPRESYTAPMYKNF